MSLKEKEIATLEKSSESYPIQKKWKFPPSENVTARVTSTNLNDVAISGHTHTRTL